MVGKGVSEGGNRKCKSRWLRVIIAHCGDCRGLRTPAVWGVRMEGTGDEPRVPALKGPMAMCLDLIE